MGTGTGIFKLAFAQPSCHL